MLVVWLLLAGLAASAPPDRSLSEKEYVALGMAAPDRTWGAADYEAAAAVLEKQAAADPSQMPRYTSASSGRVFARVTSVEDFAEVSRPMPPTQRLLLALQMLPAARRILLAYLAPASQGVVFDRELAECLGLLLAVAAETIETATEFQSKIPADDPQRSTRLEGLDKVRSGMSEVLAGGMQSITERTTYGSEARRAVARHLRAFGPRLVPHLSDLQRSEALRRLDELVAQENDEQVRKSLSELKTDCKPASQK